MSVGIQGTRLGGKHARELMVVCSEEGAAADMLENVVECGVCDRHARVERRPSPDSECQRSHTAVSMWHDVLVHDHQGTGCGMAQNRRRLDHFEHKRAAVAEEIISGADPAKDAVDDANLGVLGGHIAPGLGENGNHGRLAEERALPSLIGTSDDVQMLIRRHFRAVGCKHTRRGEQARLD